MSIPLTETYSSLPPDSDMQLAPQPIPAPTPVTTTPVQISGGGSGKASNIMAGITREQWADYVKNFFPLEDEQLTSYDNPNLLRQRIAEGKNLSRESFETATRGAQIEAGRYGLRLEDDPAYQRSLNMNRAAAQVDVGNEIRRRIQQRDQEILTGSSFGMEKTS